MEFPELNLNDPDGLKSAKEKIKEILAQKPVSFLEMLRIGRDIRDEYSRLEPLLQEFTEGFCARCKDPCCVNRHGFPDFEDLVVQKCLGIRARTCEKGLKDTGPCQCLGPMGCVLNRLERSYRCTWYFCEEVLDEFQKRAPGEFMSFEEICEEISRDRQRILGIFQNEWNNHFLKECKNNK